MVQAINSLIATRTFPASAIPATYAVHHSGWMPIIRHPERARFLQEERFPRKVKATPAEAIEHARRVIHYRRVREAEKRRKIEALSHPRFTIESRLASEARERRLSQLLNRQHPRFGLDYLAKADRLRKIERGE